jgi:hypothetical protein
LTDRLNKYLLCAYLNRLNEEDRGCCSDDQTNRLLEVRDDAENPIVTRSEETFSD